MLRGLTTLSFYADDLTAARSWYAEVLGIDAYYAFPAEGTPAYVEFRIGDYEHELGIIDSRYAPADRPDQPGGVVAYWHVDDLQASLDRLLALGATLHLPVTEQGDDSGFVTASVVDPFGNILGIMSNPHYLEILAARTQARTEATAQHTS
ncbi:VOC family protein [Mumia zhuanghuii]|uniref:VOC family protein n=2 Tax=Mumia TaxID=1546255 RepID=A0ABW1QLW3_9ACTN|nr:MULTISPECIES: VOC family protein [Mumia]KAA1419763.1 VOC family protein [Mumia zhuanghuii]